MTDAKDKTLQIIADVSGLAAGDIEPDMDLAADLGIDSPKALQLLVDLEDALDIEISDEDAAAMETVADILRYLEAR